MSETSSDAIVSIAPNMDALKSYFALNTWQFIVIVGIAITGLATFVNTYNTLTSIDSELQNCTYSSPLREELNTQFIIMLVVSILAIVLGFVLAWLLHNQPTRRRVVVVGIIVLGFFGLIYALNLKFQALPKEWKLGFSWGSFIAFLLLGFALSIYHSESAVMIKTD